MSYVLSGFRTYSQADGYQAACEWLMDKYRQQCKASGVYRASVNLRKQGCPLKTALAMLRAL